MPLWMSGDWQFGRRKALQFVDSFFDVANLFFSQASFDASTSGGKTLASTAVLAALGIINTSATTNPPGTVTLSDGTLGYGAHNFRTQSQNFGDATWLKLSGATGTNGTTDPNGGATAYTLNAGAGYLQAPGSTVTGMATGVLATESIWLKASSAVTASIVVADSNDGTPSYSYTPSLTTSWQRFSFLYTGTAASSSFLTIQIFQHASAQISVAFSQCNLGPVALDYVPTTTAAVYAPRITFDRGATQNMLLNSATLGTQTVTVVSGQVYTISALGTGTVTLSGGGSGVLTCNAVLRKQVTFTASTTSVTCTVSGSVLQANFNPGYATAYLATTGAILYTAGTPRSQNLATGSGTQSITVVPGCVYTVIHQAGGTYTLSGAGSGTTTAAVATTVVATTSTLTLTVSSAPTLLQVYEGTATLPYVTGPYSEYPQAGLLREVGRTNLLTYSKLFVGGAWALSHGGTGADPVLTANAAMAPDGTVTATKIVFDAGAGTSASDASKFDWSSTELTASVSYTASIWLRGTAGAQVVARQVGHGGYQLLTLTPYWKRHTWTEKSGDTTGEFSFGVRQGVNGTINSRVTCWAWNGQLELGAFATSDIVVPAAAAVTRDADLIRPPTSYINDTAQTTVMEFVAALPDSTAISLLTRTGSGYVAYLNNSYNALVYDSTNVAQQGLFTANVSQKVATRYSAAGLGVSLNGAAPVTASFDGAMGTNGGTVGIGDNGSGGNGFTGLITRIAIKSSAANDADLQAAAAGIK